MGRLDLLRQFAVQVVFVIQVWVSREGRVSDLERIWILEVVIHADSYLRLSLSNTCFGPAVIIDCFGDGPAFVFVVSR